MKRILSALLAVIAVVMALSFSGYSSQNGNTSKSLYDHGLELVAVVDEMAKNENYKAVYTGSPKISNIIAEFGKGEYSAPQTVYKLTPKAEYLAQYQSSDELSGMSDRVKEIILSKTVAALVTQVNAMGGAENLAATTVCTAGKTFVNSEISGTIIYLYVFENGFPVAVTFTAGEDSTVSASAMFVSCSELSTVSAESIEEFFDGGVTAEQIK